MIRYNVIDRAIQRNTLFSGDSDALKYIIDSADHYN